METHIEEQTIPPFLRLPGELIQCILSYLSPLHLLDVSETCRTLHGYAVDDQLWQRYVQESAPGLQARDTQLGFDRPTFRETYKAFAPYWFLPEHKLWFSDYIHHGKLIICRYSDARRCIEGYALVAQREAFQIEAWEHNPDVFITRLEPKIQLHFDSQVIDIKAASPDIAPGNKSGLQHQIVSTQHRENSAVIYSSLMLSRALPDSAIAPQTQVWPPLTLPAVHRTRNQSAHGYSSAGHIPLKLSEVSQHTFRLKRWVLFRHPGMSMAANFQTFGTLPREAYTPTPTRPWRGIWVGDYSGHGCEFIAFLQPEDPIDLPRGVAALMQLLRRSTSSDGQEDLAATVDTGTDAPSPTVLVETPPSNEWLGLVHETDPSLDPGAGEDSMPTAGSTPGWNALLGQVHTNADGRDASEQLETDNKKYIGQLLAVKLTGDGNVPRGEYTFIAPDLGLDGIIRVAQEDVFKGARIVRSCAHIAHANFQDGT